MGKQPGPGQAKANLLAFHAAMLRLAKEGKLAQPIPKQAWQAAMCRTITEGGSILTRQSCADKTWFLEGLGLITNTKAGITLKETWMTTRETEGAAT